MAKRSRGLIVRWLADGIAIRQGGESSSGCEMRIIVLLALCHLAIEAKPSHPRPWATEFDRFAVMKLYSG